MISKAIHYYSMLLHVPSDPQVHQVLIVQPDPEKNNNVLYTLSNIAYNDIAHLDSFFKRKWSIPEEYSCPWQVQNAKEKAASMINTTILALGVIAS